MVAFPPRLVGGRRPRFVTFYLAARSADPVLSTAPEATAPTTAASSEGISMAPAMQARNHAATGVLPATDPSKKH
jgi:hypothetical protein